ncbi:site-specific DNA-methyltransferase, partial [Helicobacter sp. MIT 14-3879]
MIPNDSIDLIFADPPYFMRVEGVLQRPEGSDFSGCDDSWDNAFIDNADYVAFSRQWLKECHRILKQNGSIWVIGSMQCIYSIGGVMQELGFWLINDVIWHKSNPTPNFNGTRLNNSHETLIWATKSKKSKYTFNYKSAKELNCEIIDFEKGVRKQLGSVWRMSVCSGNERLKDSNGKKLHNTQKPLSLLYRILAISSKMGDIVLDPFGGTMTTAVAAKILGRDYIMLEQNEVYIEYGRQRLDSVLFEDSPIARAEFDKKPLRVSLREMIKAGFLSLGEQLHLKNTAFQAYLTSEGKLEFQGQIYDIHTLAA